MKNIKIGLKEKNRLEEKRIRNGEILTYHIELDTGDEASELSHTQILAIKYIFNNVAVVENDHSSIDLSDLEFVVTNLNSIESYAKVHGWDDKILHQLQLQFAYLRESVNHLKKKVNHS